MKLLSLTFGIILTLTIVSCGTILALDQRFYNGKKVGVILQVDNIGMAKAGGQGLLDIALTSGNRFKEPLGKIESKLNMSEAIHTEISNILTSRKKAFEFIPEEFDYAALKNFVKPNPNSMKLYSNKDFRDFKSKNNVDEILYVKVRYGLLVSYHGMIEIGKQGYVNVDLEIIDLVDNSLLQKESFRTVEKIKGNWKKGEDYENLRSSIQKAINSSIAKLNTKF